MTEALYFEDEPGEMDEAAFEKKFGGIYEHSPWVAVRTRERGLSNQHNEVTRFADEMSKTLLEASDSEKLTLIQAHPDLVGREAIAGSLTTESTEEQSSAGLSNCSVGEVAHFQSLNRRYKEKHGFPFIMAVRNRTRDEIRRCFEERIDNKTADEFKTAIDQINQIALLRLQAMAAGG